VHPLHEEYWLPVHPVHALLVLPQQVPLPPKLNSARTRSPLKRPPWQPVHPLHEAD
jgi:hypothetical protein